MKYVKVASGFGLFPSIQRFPTENVQHLSCVGFCFGFNERRILGAFSEMLCLSNRFLCTAFVFCFIQRI